MNKKQLKQALLRGHGRCLQAVQAQPERYRDLVLWACSHCFSFDPQCEGTRAWFVHQLVNCYEDQTPFIETAIESLQKSRSNGSWQVDYLCELLHFFAADGSTRAREAIDRKYQQLYHALMKRRRPKQGSFYERDNFEWLCVSLAEDKASFLSIAADIGRLYRTRPFYSGEDFPWLYYASKRYLPALVKAAKKSEDVAVYLETQQAYEKAWEEESKRRATGEKKGFPLYRWLAKEADRETVLQYAAAYQKEADPKKRATALRAFCWCPYPEDPAPIIADAQSDCEELRKAAWNALENIRHPLVREFAFANMQENTVDVIPLITKNYQSQDADLLQRLVKSVPIDHDNSSGWHGVHMDVLDMANDHLKAPAAILEYIYESTYCSSCRAYVLRQMGKRHMLTEERLRECLHDSFADIRTYAKQCLRRRERSKRV